jgi:hypothetical protein
MENQRHFVCSRGLLKSCTVHSTQPQSSCNKIEYLNQMTGRPGMSIYVCSDALKSFVANILPKIKHPFVLVSGDSDMCVPYEALSLSETQVLLHHPYLLKWFAQNTPINAHKLVQLPIGLDYHTLSNNPAHSWKTEGEGSLPKDQEDILMQVRQYPFHKRLPLIYVNFSTQNDRYHQRKCSLAEISPDLLHINQSFTQRTENWKKMSRFAFVLSPFGMGMDCHRTWEALCLGCIPIVKAPHFQPLFEGLPVLLVNEWSEITRERLDQTLIAFQQRSFHYDKLTLRYWVAQIRAFEPKFNLSFLNGKGNS